MKIIFILTTAILMSACADQTPLEITRGLLGYTPPPPETTVAEELREEFNRCEKINPDRKCAQIAYDVVRKVKGLDPRKVPKGVVIILQGDVDMEAEKNGQK